MRAHLIFGLVIPGLLLAGTSSAQSPNTDRSFRDGANHHLGDTAFLEQYGRPPTEQEEHLRIRTHFLAVQKLLASRPATRPELEDKRKVLLAHFADYIAKGTTPKNEHLPWRTPVFIDDDGTICAVGYLIEQSAGRAVADKIAASHRYSYIEEIAKAMPEVRQWVEQSGFTLEELGSIQPGYEGPDVAHESAWTLADAKVPDGAYSKDGVTGTIRHHHMEGAWRVKTGEGHVIGAAKLSHGNGAWLSSYANGKRMAEGRYSRDQPNGVWRFFHPSGNLAAEGRLSHGSRDGRWEFFYDSKTRTKLATGSFEQGFTVGTWHHYDNEGKLLAVSTATRADGRFLLDIVPGKDGIGHQIDQQGFTGDHHRLDMVSKGAEHLYVQQGVDTIFDQDGNQLVREGTTWTAVDCGWDRSVKRAAHNGRIEKLHDAIRDQRYAEHAECPGESVKIAPARGKLIDTMLASIRAVRAQTPDFMRKVALGEETVADATDPDAAEDKTADLLGQGQVDDLSKVLAANMTWFIEWPHIDGKFSELYASLAGFPHRSDN
ncbi:MAG TPA: hypothetical protein VFQ65_21340 [Kofleriaceae bacterium]|nr:hypothetical protein [Kofleriaceae bacterium]